METNLTGEKRRRLVRIRTCHDRRRRQCREEDPEVVASTRTRIECESDVVERQEEALTRRDSSNRTPRRTRRSERVLKDLGESKEHRACRLLRRLLDRFPLRVFGGSFAAVLVGDDESRVEERR